MFKDDYRDEMNKQNPSEESLLKLQEKMKKAELAKKGRKAVFMRTWKTAIALAACAAITLSFSNPLVTIFSDPDSTAETVQNYDELYTLLDTLSNNTKSYDYNVGMIMDSATGSPQEKSAAQNSDTSGSSTAAPDYSDTNIQVEGVQEADVIKTDGKYIYAVSSSYIYIISAKDGQLELLSKLDRYEYKDNQKTSIVSEIYINADRLILIKNQGGYYSGYGTYGTKGYYAGSYVQEMGVEIYDIKDKTAPAHVDSFGQSGNYISSRMVGNVLYLVSSYYIYNYGDIDKGKPETFVPSITRDGNTAAIAASDIIVCSEMTSLQYTVVSGIDTSGDGKLVSSKSLLGYGSQLYANEDNLYIAAATYVNEESKSYSATNLIRLSLHKGKIEYGASGKVPGGILNQFSMDQYKDVFRIVTTYNEYMTQSSTYAKIVGDIAVSPSQNIQYNCLYTLDQDFNIIGKIENIAEGERVYSVRFMGDTGYFVTFRQVDPLFAVDLSDAANPEILSALKIPGFSQYMHPYGDGLLFGIGRDADATTGRAGYMKLSMFDTSNPADVTEKHKLVLNGFNYSEASYNHKAILIDKDKNIIAFPADGKYLVYSYSDNDGFIKMGEISTSIQNGNSYYQFYAQNMRGLYIGDYLYVFSYEAIASYNMKDYKLSDYIIFETNSNETKPPYAMVD